MADSGEQEKPRRGIHVWIFAESKKEVLLKRHRSGLWDVSASTTIPPASSSLLTARREIKDKLGVTLPNDAFELLFVFRQQGVMNDVYLVTTLDPIPLEAFTLQETEVSTVKYICYEEYKKLLAKKDSDYVPYDVQGQYGQLFDTFEMRYKDNTEARISILQNQLKRYTPIPLYAELSGLTESDREALEYIVKATAIVNEIFSFQAWHSNPVLRDWLKEHADRSELDQLRWSYYQINKTPWSSLDENKAFLTTADSAIRLLPKATRNVKEWKGLEYKAAFPVVTPPGANFYPPDMDKTEFEAWKESLEKDKQKEATGFFSVIKRHSEFGLDSDISDNKVGDASSDLYIAPYSQEYKPLLEKAAELLHKAADITDSSSLKRFLHSKADAFLSNDYYDSDIAWMELDSKLDITIGPYETYTDKLFGYKATFEAFIGVRDEEASAQLKLFGDNLQVLEQNLPLDSVYKSEHVNAAPIRIIQLICNAGDVRGPQIVAYNLPNDERIVKDRGTSMVMLKNVQEAKFEHILLPIAELCIAKEQQEFVDFESFFTHTICHECCHGIGPHSITLPNGQKSTVRLELQEFHSAMEEAKADIVGLWALRFLIHKGFLSESLLKSMYVSFLAGCFRSVRFGLEEAHGKGQALQFNWLYERGAYILHSDDTFSVNYSKIKEAVESLSREILTIQAKGEKEEAGLLLEKYGVISEPLKLALNKLENVQVPVDIAPSFPIAEIYWTDELTRAKAQPNFAFIRIPEFAFQVYPKISKQTKFASKCYRLDAHFHVMPLIVRK